MIVREPNLTKDRANDSDDKAKKAEAPSTSDRVSESGVVDSGDKARRLRAQLAAYGDQDASATHIGKSAAEIGQLKASGLASKFELVDDEKSSTLLKGSVQEIVQAKAIIRPAESTLHQKLSNFVQSAEARLLDPAGQQKYFQGQIDKIQGIGDGLNIAKEEMKVAGRKAWDALQDGSVAKFLAQPNAINEPLFHAIGKSFDAMKKDPQTVNHVLEHLGHELIAANDKYNTLSEHDKGVEIGKAMFFFVNPEGSTEGGATALKVADRVATHVDAAATKAIDHTLEASTNLATRATEAAQEAKQFIAESMQQGQMKPALAGGPGNAFEPHVSQPKPKLNDHTMAMSSDGIGAGAAGDGLANAGKAGDRAPGDAVVKVEGHPRAFFGGLVEQPGDIKVGYLMGSTLPKGTGNFFLSESLRMHGELPTNKLIIKQIVNEETVKAWKFGDPAERTLMAKCASKALKNLGITPVEFKFEVVNGSLNIVITTRR